MSRGAFDLGRKAVYMIIAVIIIAVVFIYMRNAVIVNTIKVVSEADRVENEIIVQSLLFSPKCLAYSDTDTGRVYPGTIDFSKFSSALDPSCLKYFGKDVKFRLIRGQSGRDFSNFAGMSVMRRVVVVRDGGDVYNAILEVGVGPKK